MKLLLILSTLLLTSCASYVDKMHQSFDRNDKRKVRAPRTDKFDMYRYGQNNNFNSSPNTGTHRKLAPQTQRAYQDVSTARKRFRADDLTDNQNNASLWGNDDSAQFLFTQSTEKKTGEIILINVKKKLKSSITAELKRAFPDPPPLPTKKKKDGDAKDGDKKEGEAAKTAAKPEPKPTEQPEQGGAGKVYDRISSVIIEKINKNHLLLKGRKTLLYKKRKRTVEVQALISKKHITSDDSVDSDTILESNVRVVR